MSTFKSHSLSILTTVMNSKIFPLCENALTVELGTTIGMEAHHRVMAFCEILEQHKFKGLIEAVPAYTSVTIFYEPIIVLRSSALRDSTPSQWVRAYVEDLLKILSPSTKVTQRIHSIPVCYDREFGLDLDFLSTLHHISSDDIIHLHSGKEYTVYMLGFTPGFPYMGIVEDQLASPRKENPRTIVPGGSVGIAGKQTGIYPFATPGGWQIIGRTPWKLFDPEKKSPTLLKAGDRVRFFPITKKEFDQLNHE